MRAIDADLTQDAISKAIETMLDKSNDKDTQYVVRGLISFKRMINMVPTLDVAPVSHGFWAKTKLGLVCRESICSECKQPPIKTGSCSY